MKKKRARTLLLVFFSFFTPLTTVSRSPTSTPVRMHKAHVQRTDRGEVKGRRSEFTYRGVLLGCWATRSCSIFL